MTTMLLPSELVGIVRDDALECVRRTRRYKFGRLSNRRIVQLFRSNAARCGCSLPQSDAELIDLWFTEYDRLLKTER
jgi:hypothetical protein